MPNIFKDIKVHFKDLPPKEQQKALEIANKLMADGKSEKEAVQQAIKEAAQWGFDERA